MRVLLLDPRDGFHRRWIRQPWDLIVDLGRAPGVFYEKFAAELGCRVFSIYDLAREIDDFVSLRELVAPGMGLVVDRHGIDWWDVVSPLLQPDLQDIRLGLRLATQCKECAALVATRSTPVVEAVGIRCGVSPRIVSGGVGNALVRGVARRSRAAASLDLLQLRQVIFDKYDPHYRWRRKFAPRAQDGCNDPVVLLPTAYSNVTKTAYSWARLLPDRKFLAVIARESAAGSPVPPNIEEQWLASFATAQADDRELKCLQDSWSRLCGELRDKFPSPVQHEILHRGARWLRWGVAVRDAWLRVFESRAITGCLSADDSNPYTRIPLLLARKRGIPAVACHHGALDCRMIFKNHAFTSYLAKGDMERDYLERICKVDPGRIKVGDLPEAGGAPMLWRSEAPCLTFFTEPYETDCWRTEEIYREVLPHLIAVARGQGKRLLIKLHPFESIRRRRTMIGRMLSSQDRRIVEITDAPMTAQILRDTWCAVTVESTVAFECASAGIPVFLFGWLRHAYAGYAPQYAHFGVGHLMSSAAGILQIPDRLRFFQPDPEISARLNRPLPEDVLSQVLCQAQPAL